MFYRNKADAESILRRLSGRKHLVVGNHDHAWIKSTDLGKWFQTVNEILVLKEEGRVMTLCHYPLLSWPHMEHGGWCIYGHIHNSIPDGARWDLISQEPRLLNAGVDINGFYPVTFDELIANNDEFRKIHQKQAGS